MNQKAKLEITFTREAVDGEQISLYRVKDGSLVASRLLSTFKPTRTQNKELPILEPTAIAGEAAAIAYQTYFNTDFNLSGLMTISRVDNVITLEVENGWTFGTYTSDCGATFVYTSPIADTFQIVSVVEQESSTPNETVLLEVTTTELADSYSFIGSYIGDPIPVNTNPIIIEVQRTVPTRIMLQKTGHDDLSLETYLGKDYIYFRKILATNVSFDVVTSMQFGSTVKFNVGFGNQLTQKASEQLELEYSLDGVNWSSQSFVTGQTEGDYTVYVRDQYGGIVEVPLNLRSSDEDRTPYVSISDLNSIGFAESQKWNGIQAGIDKNQENVLDVYDRQPTLYDERIVYRQDDGVRLQFKSNRATNTAKIEDCYSGNSFDFIVEKMSNNLNLKEILDAKMVSYGDGSLTAIYYDAGNIYDENDDVIGTYELNGNLPDSAIIGNEVFIAPVGTGVGGYFRIMDIFYDSGLGKNVMVFDYNCESIYPVDVITTSIYDLLNYDIYEFSVSFSTVLSGLLILTQRSIETLRINITCGSRNFYSNWIEVLRNATEYNLNDFVSIKYWNKNNRSIFYAYGIQHFFRAEIESLDTIFDDKVDVVKGDSSTYLSESVLNHGIKIAFAPVTHKVLMKYALAMSSEFLVINGLQYVKSAPLESEPIPNTNLYNLSCTFLRTSENFNTFVEGDEGNGEGYENIYIPQLITTNLGGSLKV